MEAAAFGRLCVETYVSLHTMKEQGVQPPSGGCVLKQGDFAQSLDLVLAAAFGRLCVETLVVETDTVKTLSSRLRAAVC